MPVIDFHSHLLPGIDDGSRDLDTSLQILDIAARQGVEWMIATPHFYASRDRMDRFFARREQAFEKVKGYLRPGMPKICCGAEVAFFPGISRAEKLDSLTIGDTGTLLLELPFGEWSDSLVEEVRFLLERRHLSVVLAHLERYFDIPGSKKKLQRLLELPVVVQVNSGSLLDWKMRRKIFRCFGSKDGAGMVLGSDCHGITHRPPDLAEGRAMILKKRGQDFLDRIDRTGSRLLRIEEQDAGSEAGRSIICSGE